MSLNRNLLKVRYGKQPLAYDFDGTRSQYGYAPDTTRLIRGDAPILQESNLFTLEYQLASNKTFREPYYVEKQK